MSKVIFLNGCGSSGKTAIAKSIQHLGNKPWLRLGVDLFIDMIPDRYMGFGDKAREGYFSFIPGQNEQGPTMGVQMTQKGDHLFRSLPNFAKMLADQGHHLIIDEILFGDELLRSYEQELAPHTFYFIGVLCDLPVLQEREILRGDRAIGLANDQVHQVHKRFRPYDLSVDTTHRSAFEVAQEILDFVG